jgi:hypothetical protein
MKNKFLTTTLILFLGGTFGWPVGAFEIKETYPRLANYYLQPLIPEDHYDDLAKYDLLILDVDTQTINPMMFSEFKEDNQDIQFLAYIPSQSVNIEDLSSWARWRQMTYDKVDANDWWLRDSQGEIIDFSDIWSTIKFVDIGSGWKEYLSDLVAEDVIKRNIWQGIFYDMVFADISWLNNGDIDIDQDGQPDNTTEINNYWQLHMDDLINQTKTKIGYKSLVANLDRINTYEDGLDGLMMENFPKQGAEEKKWSVLTNHYLNNPFFKNQSRPIYIINSNTNNIEAMDSYREMRFGLTSTLLGDGYYSFDCGDQTHSQVWWYDEYNINLGRAESAAYNLLDQPNKEIKPGLWRRDFGHGLALVNSTNQKQTYVFQIEEFEKINGQQDRRINNGVKINWISLEPKDGIILLKINTEIKNNSFNNGSFVRVFNQKGEQVRNGFFAFKDNFPGQSRILITDIDNDGDNEILVSEEGTIAIYKESARPTIFKPYGEFKGEISLAVEDIDNDGLKEIITGAGSGGGPHVKVLSLNGQTLNEFMAYDENMRSGIMVITDDTDEDNLDEILVSTISF